MNGKISSAIAQHEDGEDIVAVRAQRPIRRAEFQRDVAALAARLPSHKYILNACTDRYRFMVGLAAALRRQQISLMPPSDAPAILQAVAEDYPDLYALTDSTSFALPSLTYPGDLDRDGSDPDLLAVPDEQPALIFSPRARPVGQSRCRNPGVRSFAARGPQASGWGYRGSGVPL